MAKYYHDILSVCARCQELSDKLLAYPAAGVHAGGGIHVPQLATVSIGWTVHYAAYTHVVLLDYRVQMDLVGPALSNPAYNVNLTGPELTELTVYWTASLEE